MELEILEEAPTFTLISLAGRLDTAGVDRVETKLNATLNEALASPQVVGIRYGAWFATC